MGEAPASLICNVIDDVRIELGQASTKRLQAVRHLQMTSEKLGELEAKARFALEQNREDLAEAVISRQVDFESQIALLEKARDQAAIEGVKLEACITALAARKQDAMMIDGCMTQGFRSVASGTAPLPKGCSDAYINSAMGLVAK